MTARVSKIAMITIASLLLAAGGAALFTQTFWFRETVRSTLYTYLQKEINADIYIGEIHGNLFTGLSVDTVMMYVDGAPFVESGRLSVRYDLLDLLENRITVDSISVENPIVHLIRWKNGQWNTERLSKNPSPPDSIPSALYVQASKLRLYNAQFRLTDSTAAYDSIAVDRNGRRVMNYSDIRLEQLFLELEGTYAPDHLTAVIHHLSFIAPREHFTLLKFTANVGRYRDSAYLRAMTLTTPFSKVAVNAVLRGADVFAVRRTEDLQKADVTLNVAPSNIMAEDIQTFLPSLSFLKGNVNFDGAMEGDFENLTVRSLNASFGGSAIALSGTVSNIHHPKELRLNVVSNNSTIEPSDIPALMPFFNIPDYRQLGTLTVDLQFVGKPLDFLAIAKVRSSAGTVSVDGQMMITEENIHYKGILAGTDVNLEKVFASNEYFSRLNTRIFIEGDGTTLATLNSEATVEIDSSQFRNIPIHSSKVHIAARNRKVETDLTLRSPNGNVTAKAAADFAVDSIPTYAIQASVRGLDLAPVVQDERYRSDLSFDISRSGKGLTMFDNPSETSVDFSRSNFNGMSFDSVHAVIQWLKDSSNTDRLIVRSPVVDGTVQGRFTFGGLLQAVKAHLEGFGKMYNHQRRIMDSSYAQMMDSAFVRDTVQLYPGTFAYDLTMKDLRPISIVFDFPELQLVGTARGAVTSTNDAVSSAGEFTISRGWYADTTQPMTMKNIHLQYRAKGIVPATVSPFHDSLELGLHVRGDEYTLDGTAFRLANIDLEYAHQAGQFTIGSDIDTTLTFKGSGSIDVAGLTDTVRFNDLYAKYQGLDLRSASPFVLHVSSTGVRADSVRFLRRDEDVLVSGNVDYQGLIKAEATVRNFDLADLFFVNSSHTYRQHALEMGGRAELAAKFGGTARNPVITAQIEAKDIAFRNSRFGNAEVALHYAKKRATVKVEMTDVEDAPVPQTLEMEGVFPIDMSFLPVKERLDFDGMDMTVKAQNLTATMFDVLIPSLDHISGRLSGSVAMAGSLVHPRLVGTMTLDSTLFRLELNNITYRAKGTVVLDSGKLFFPEFTVRNLEQDYADGAMQVGGFVVMDGFAPDEYHLTMNGEMLAFNSRERTANQPFYGRLIGRTGPKGLRFEGTYDRSRIIGDIFVQDALLTFPPTQQTVVSNGMRFDDVVFVDDTSRISADSAAAVLLAAVAQVLAPGGVPSVKDAERTFMDGFGYELTITTQSNVRVQMIFNANAGTYEELVAELNGKMVLKKDEVGQQLTGTINIGDGSSYKYYKEFKATGSMTFVGDPQNPQLAILAKYTGTHLRDPKDPTTEERVVVSLEITGTRLSPKLKIGLATISNNDPNSREIPRPGDVENDAIAFLLTSSQNKPGQFREELSSYERNKLGEQLYEAVGGTFVNSLLAGVVNDFITRNNIPYVKRVEVRSVIPSEANINTTLEVSAAVINIGGKVFTDVNNTNVSVQVPVLGRQNRNFIFEVEKRTENADYTSIQAKTILGARLFYRFTF